MEIKKEGTMNKSISRITSIAVLLSALSTSVIADVSFEIEILKNPAGTPNGSGAALVNGDGSSIVVKGTKPGTKKDENVPLVFHWNSKDGYTPLGLLNKRNVLIPMDISDDGNVVVGHNASDGFIWTQQNKMQVTPKLKSSFISNVISISGDGSTLVGYAGWQSNLHGYRWKRGQKIEDVGIGVNKVEWRMATRVSGDGRVVVGSDREGVFVWRENKGRENLKSPEGCQFIADALSADGSRIGGRCSNDIPMIWDEYDGFKQLPIPEGARSAMVHDMSADGNRFIGTARYSGNNYESISKPIMWIDEKIYFLDNIIKKLKPEINFKKLWFKDISSNGKVVVGGYQSNRPYSYPWKLTIKD